MFQSFDVASSPEQGPPRIAALRDELQSNGLDAFLVPRADAYQGEYVAECDARLSWLTGFTGSAGMAVIGRDCALLLVDGRYSLQARAQVDGMIAVHEVIGATYTDPIADALAEGAVIGFDPWLHTRSEIERLRKRLPGRTLRAVDDNPVDRIWTDRPPAPSGAAMAYPKGLAGEGDDSKRARISETLRDEDQHAAILTLPDSICWLLNIRGTDIPRNPIVQAFAILYDDGRVGVFSDPVKFDALGPDPAISLHHLDAFLSALATLSGPVRLDRDSAPYILGQTLEDAGVDIAWAADPCILPKACKSQAEIAATRAAHLRDGAAMCEFLCWLDTRLDGVTRGEILTEIDVARSLEGFRRATNALRDISFDTIAGTGPNGAITHYRVSEDTNRRVAPGDLLLVDSGGQYLDGTTDITRTMAVGDPDADQIAAFTRVLQGMIAVSRARWPEGLAGRDLDALARAPLWMAGQDYAHGTGHGVGVYLSVHEGPQRLSRISEVPLAPGMILSNEPGYYREGAWGIRIENLVVVERAPDLPGGDPGRDMLSFETLTYVPIDRRLIDVDALASGERAWLDAYHAAVARQMAGRLSAETAGWLSEATAPL